MARVGYKGVPYETQDHEGSCGGKRFLGNGKGICGICGNTWNPRPGKWEAPGRFATGQMTGVYKQGQVIEITTQVTANHKGYYEMKLCKNDGSKKDPTQDCFDK